MYSTMKGFSLPELLICLGLLAILATIALPLSHQWLSQHQVDNASMQLVNHLHFARQQAINRQQVVTVCPSIDQKTCGNQQHWQHGYLIFADPHASHQLTPTSQLLISEQLAIGTLSNTRDYIQFASNGSSRSSNSTFVYQHQAYQRKVIISLQGRIRCE